MSAIDLKELLRRESDQVEWKEGVFHADDVAETLAAFANDWSNLGGGYVVCGAREDKDEHGFPTVTAVGLSAAQIREVEGRVLTACRDRVSPSVAPRVEELAADSADRRVLVFIMPATRSAHLFRRKDEAGKYFVRIGRETREARNGILRELLVRKGDKEVWDRRMCPAAGLEDIDILSFRDALQRMRALNPALGIEEYLSDSRSLSPFVPPLGEKEPLTGVTRPRNFAMLLFGRDVQKYIPGAFTIFSIYPGLDRSEPHAQRFELTGTLTDQARRLIELLNVESFVAFDKTERASPNAVKYPVQALHEAMINALAHRDYELNDPTRITVFSDRIEIVSPGTLPRGISFEDFSQGRAPAKWRNQSLAWFLNRLQFAQAEGQGIPTILRSMREEGCPPPRFQVTEERVICTLPAHPRHAVARDLRRIEELISLGEFEHAQSRIAEMLALDPMNARTLQLFGEISRALKSPEPVRSFIAAHREDLTAFPAAALTSLADALSLAGSPTKDDLAMARVLYLGAAGGRMEERALRQVALGLSRSGDDAAAVELISSAIADRPELGASPGVLQIRGNALLGKAKICSRTGQNRDLPVTTKRRAWEDCRRFIAAAEVDLRRAASLTSDPAALDSIERNLKFAERFRNRAAPPEQRKSRPENKTPPAV